MPTNIGTAYVQILPSAEGIRGKLEGLFSGEGAAAGNSFSSKFAGALGAIGTAGTAVLGAASAGISAFAKSAVDSYADFEQLVGGVETLFQGSAGAVQDYAKNAFQTAGMSANEYMETVTGFAASLTQSLGGDTAKAAEMANTAVTDMADNANKMGSSMESIQNAYQGFAKGQYNMLDNLKLGYGGTQQEMYRLLQDAAGLNEEFANTANFSIDNKGHLEAGYADIVQAIHIVQDSMGIAGTTAKEASETISGSLASLGAAWKNVLTGIGDDNADFDGLVNNLVDSAHAALKNVLPRVEQIMSGAGRLVERLAPVITAELPGMVERVVPGLLQAAVSLVGTLGTAIVDCLPVVGQVAMDLFETLSGTLSAQLPELIPMGVNAVFEFVDGLLTNSDQLIDGGLALIEGLVYGIVDAMPILAEKGPEICIHLAEAIIKAAPKLIVASFELTAALADGLANYYQTLFDAGTRMLTTVKEGFMSLVGDAFTWGKDLVAEFIRGMFGRLDDLASSANSVAQVVRDRIGFSEPKTGPLSNFHTYAPDMMALYAGGIRSNAGLVSAALEDSLELGDSLTRFPARRYAAAAQPAAAGSNQAAQTQGAAPRTQTVILMLERTELARAIVELGDEERQRIGVRLAKGAV